MAGPNLRRSDVERRLKISAAMAMLEEGERQAESGNFEEVRAALVLIARAGKKLAEVVEEIDKGGQTT